MALRGHERKKAASGGFGISLTGQERILPQEIVRGFSKIAFCRIFCIVKEDAESRLRHFLCGRPAQGKAENQSIPEQECV